MSFGVSGLGAFDWFEDYIRSGKRGVIICLNFFIILVIAIEVSISY